MNLLDSLFGAGMKLAQTGFAVAEAAAQSAQLAVERVTGLGRDSSVQPPTSGPRDLDRALSELANRTARIVHFTPPSLNALPEAAKNWLEAARFCFRFVDWKDPHNLALPLAAPFSLATLAAQMGVRGLASFEAIGAPRYIEFLKYSIQIFSEFPVYVGLEYGDVIARQRQWLSEHPEDQVTRTELGRSLLKVGQFTQAAKELELAGRNPEVRSVAMHEAGLAYYNLGDFAAAIRSGCAALEADPNNGPARRSGFGSRLNGSEAIPSVPLHFRLKPKKGWEKPTVEYQEISARCGLDKTSGGRGIAVYRLQRRRPA